MAFEVEGQAPNGQRRAKRERAASAIVLARRWEQAGLNAVFISVGNLRLPVDAFQEGYIHKPPTTR